MLKRTYRIGIAGCGKVAQLHARAIQELEGAQLVGAWSRSEKSARDFAEQHDATAYPSVARMVAEGGLDVVIVCTPHPYHKAPAIEAARSGANVLVDKPLASTLADCDEMIAACRECGVELSVVSQRRWYEPAIRVKRAIDDGKIGKPMLASMILLGWRDQAYYDADEWRGTWRQEGGGVLVNQAPHLLDLLLWYMGEVEEVFGLWRNLNHPGIEVEDTALAIIKFKSGAVGNIVASNSQKPGLYGKVHVHGSNGASVGAQTEGGAMFIAGATTVPEPPMVDLWTVPDEGRLMEEWAERDAASFAEGDPTTRYIGCQILDFLQALEQSRRPAVTGEDGRKVVELFTAIYRSNRDNEPVVLPLSPEAGRSDMDGRLA